MYKAAASVNSFESSVDGTEVFGAEGESYKSNWTVSSDYSFDGSKSIVAGQKAEAFGVVKAENMKYVRLAARNADDHKGNGTFEIYYSVGGTHRDNFIRLQTVTTTEQWQDVMCELPEGTEYIGLAKAAGNPDQYIDGVSFYKEQDLRPTATDSISIATARRLPHLQYRASLM